MADLISRAALKRHYAWWGDTDGRRLLDCIVDAQDAVDAVPVVHARWIDTGADYWERGRTSTRYKCSNCGRKAGEKQVRVYFYCPKCGAKMDLGKEQG